MNILLNSRNDQFFEAIEYIKNSAPDDLEESVDALIKLKKAVTGAIELKFQSTAKAREGFKNKAIRVFRGDALDDFRSSALTYVRKNAIECFERTFLLQSHG
jgi:hypothetical protein